MVFKTDFHVQVDYDDSGLIVVVTHKPTSITRHARPATGESVQAVKDKLLLEVRNQIYSLEEFQYEYVYGRSEVDGKTRTYVYLRHMPTGKTRSISDKEQRDEMLDEIVRELWSEGPQPK